MTPARLKALIEALPIPQRKDAEMRIRQAIAMNWDEAEIGLRTPRNFEPDILWLGGMHPMDGDWQVLPEVE